MKKILLLLLITLSSLATISAQTDNRFIGVYEQGKAARLFIFPNGTYAVSYYGRDMAGTWQEYDKYLIMKPDASVNEKFYMFAGYNKMRRDISVQFDRFESKKVVYSLSKGEEKVMMHPIFNPSPTCITYPVVTAFDKDKYTQIQLADLADYDRVNTPVDNVSMQSVYTFPISAEYNEYKIVLANTFDEAFLPFFAALDNNVLYFNDYQFYYIGTLEEENKERLNLAKEVAASVNQPMKSYPLGKNNKYINGVEIEYPAVPYTKKEYKEITFDGNNLFTAKCNGNDTEVMVDSVYLDTSVVIGF